MTRWIRRGGQPVAPPERWVDRPPVAAGGHPDDVVDRAAELFRRAEAAPPLGAAALARTRERLHARGGRSRWRTRRLAVAPAALLVAVAVVVGAGGLVLAGKGLARLAAREATSAPAKHDPKSRRAPRRLADGTPPLRVAPPATSPLPAPPAPPLPVPPASASPAPAPASAAAAPAPAPAAAPAPGHGHDRAARAAALDPRKEPPVRPPIASPPAPAPGAPAAAGPATGDGALSEETQLLAAALRKLRRDREPAAALDLLDQHRARFAVGALAAEANVARVDALLALGRRKAALEVLEGLSLAGYSRRRELLVLRGELQTEAGDCAEALLDLDICARVPAGDLIEERAIYGKAVCLARLGQRAEASAVLQGYLRRFPRGRFVALALESLMNERP